MFAIRNAVNSGVTLSIPTMRYSESEPHFKAKLSVLGAATYHGTKEEPYLDRGYKEVGEIAVPPPLSHTLFHPPQELAWREGSFDQIS